MNGTPETNFQEILEEIPSVLTRVQKKVYIDFFKMDDRILKFIIETCHNVPELILNYCQIDSIRSSFELDQTLDYKIKTLDIYGTVNPNNDGYL